MSRARLVGSRFTGRCPIMWGWRTEPTLPDTARTQVRANKGTEFRRTTGGFRKGAAARARPRPRAAACQAAVEPPLRDDGRRGRPARREADGDPPGRVEGPAGRRGGHAPAVHGPPRCLRRPPHAQEHRSRRAVRFGRDRRRAARRAGTGVAVDLSAAGVLPPAGPRHPLRDDRERLAAAGPLLPGRQVAGADDRSVQTLGGLPGRASVRGAASRKAPCHPDGEVGLKLPASPARAPRGRTDAGCRPLRGGRESPVYRPGVRASEESIHQWRHVRAPGGRQAPRSQGPVYDHRLGSGPRAESSPSGWREDRLRTAGGRPEPTPRRRSR